MSVSLTFTVHRTALQRVQPLDPSFQADWTASVTGDGTGGQATITASIGANLAVITEYMSAADGSGVATEADMFIATGIQPGPAAFGQAINLHDSSVGVRQSLFTFIPPRTMMIPDLGGQITFSVEIANPGLTELLVFHGRCYLWPRSEVIDLPQRTFWPYLSF